MRNTSGTLLEIHQLASGERAGLIDCPPGGLPQPGAYLLATNPREPQAATGSWLFPVDLPTPAGAQLLAPLPPGWSPGDKVLLRGPLGHGFDLFPTTRRLGLLALGESPARLLATIAPALAAQADIALFTDLKLPPLPSAIEIHPLAALTENLTWADQLFIDLPAAGLPSLQRQLGLQVEQYLPCPAQILLSIAMPCAGIGACGACAIPTRRGYLLACQDGPVFDLSKLDW